MRSRALNANLKNVIYAQQLGCVPRGEVALQTNACCVQLGDLHVPAREAAFKELALLVQNGILHLQNGVLKL